MYKCYDNRELSWLKFNERVLNEAVDTNVPLCERIMFASIFQSNLDEFFMIRVGSLYDQTLVDNPSENKTGMTCKEQLDAIYKRVGELVPVRDGVYGEIIEDFKRLGVEQVDFRSISQEEEAHLKDYFIREIQPLVSPQVIDKRHPFPFLKNKEIYAVMSFETKSSVKIGVIPASGAFSRIIFLPNEEKIRFMLVEDLILHFAPMIFSNYKIAEKSLIRITRNADINMEEALYDHDVDLRDIMGELLKKRKKLSPVRMEMSRKLAPSSVEFLMEKLELVTGQIYRMKSPLDLSFVFTLRNKLEKQYPSLFFERADPQNSPLIVKTEPMINQIKKKDLFLFYPYESIKPFIRLLNEAAEDPDVVSIRITLYRVASNSKVVEALINAAENGKSVFVLVELRARFDEENNIEWSKRLEHAGCSVIYGPEHIKVHSKLLLITRKSSDKIEYITQIGTGNYNEKTSALYTDFSLMTADQNIGAEASVVFNNLAIGHLVENTNHLLVAPLSLQNKIIEMIDYEIALAKTGEEAYIGLKLNSLTDKKLMDKLVEASQSGVKIQMVIRGICCLVAGVKDYTENIEVISIVGRYLEHARIYIFGTGIRQKIYISSADFMTRNTLRRVEVASPIYDPDVRARIISIFNTMLADNVKARVMQPDGTYIKRLSDQPPLNSQEYFIRQAYQNAEKVKSEQVKKVSGIKLFFEKLKKLFSK